MSDLREAARQALEALEAGPDVDPIFAGETIDALRAALAQEQEQKQRLLEAVRVRIMRTAYDRAEYGEIEAYNGVKVLCSEVLEMLK